MLCLDEAVLALARLYREDVLALPADDNFNRANRHSEIKKHVLKADLDFYKTQFGKKFFN